MGSSFFFDFASGANKAYVPYPLYAFEKGMGICLGRGIISPGTAFLDLGAGKGRVVRSCSSWTFCIWY